MARKCNYRLVNVRTDGGQCTTFPWNLEAEEATAPHPQTSRHP